MNPREFQSLKAWCVHTYKDRSKPCQIVRYDIWHFVRCVEWVPRVCEGVCCTFTVSSSDDWITILGSWAYIQITSCPKTPTVASILSLRQGFSWKQKLAYSRHVSKGTWASEWSMHGHQHSIVDKQCRFNLQICSHLFPIQSTVCWWEGWWQGFGWGGNTKRGAAVCATRSCQHLHNHRNMDVSYNRSHLEKVHRWHLQGETRWIKKLLNEGWDFKSNAVGW